VTFRYQIFFGFLFLFPNLGPAEPCEVTRCILEIGPKVTRVTAAKVDICQRQVEVIYPLPGEDGIVRVSYPKKKAKTISGRVIRDEVVALESLQRAAEQRLRTQMPSLPFQGCRGVVASSIRSAANLSEAAVKISTRSHVDLKVLSPEEEGRLMVLAAALKTNLAEENIMVWQVGPLGLQASSLAKNPKSDSGAGIYTVSIPLGMGANRKLIVAKLQGQGTGLRPEPVEKDLVRKVVEASDAPGEWKEIANSDSTRVILVSQDERLATSLLLASEYWSKDIALTK
jgi:hypothetical protein